MTANDSTALRAPAEERDTPHPLRVLAFYLPQFHPIPENDEWWGRGFTEWRNVARARPRFRGHEQPRLPGELGWYDLRVPEVREAQADLAREHGIFGFVYYHYWFGGRRLLERPLDEVLRSGRPDFPFCVCWANENWTRRWSGGDDQVLIAQRYGDDDDRAYIRLVLEYAEDDRYVRVDGKPLVLVYRTSQLPQPARTVETWREEAAKRGTALYICGVESFSERIDPGALGVDAAVDFQPRLDSLGQRVGMDRSGRVLRRLLRPSSPLRMNSVYRYEQLIENALGAPEPAYKRYPCVVPGWDNSPRRAAHARIVHGSTPQRYEHWLRATAQRFQPFSPDENFLFVNAWNEWAEGAYLEPDERWGRRYLEVHKRLTAATVAP